MRSRTTLFVAGAVLAFSAGTLTAQADAETGSLSLKAYKTFKHVMPKDVWVDVQGVVPLQHSGSDGFRAVRSGLKLEVDTNGDGRPNDEVKGASGFLVFRSGKDFRYAARFQGSSRGFKVACSGSMKGRVGGVPIEVFDLNCNGIYGELGKDAIVVGRSKAASYLSKVISYGDKLYSLEVAASGLEATVTPFEGETGVLSVAKGFSAKGRLLAAVVQDEQGNSFEVANERSGLTVPVGSYKLVSGYVEKGSQSVRIRAGKMQPIVVKAGDKTELDWGAPVQASIVYSFDGTEAKVDPTGVHFYGNAGEEYYDWQPGAKSPKFTVLDAETGKEVGGFQYVAC